MDFQAGGNKIKAQRNEIQIRCNRIQIPRNRIQMPFPSTNACFSIGYPGFRQAPTPCGPVAGRPGADVQPGSTFAADGGVTFRKTKYLFGVWQENVDFSTKVDFTHPASGRRIRFRLRRRLHRLLWRCARPYRQIAQEDASKATVKCAVSIGPREKGGFGLAVVLDVTDLSLPAASSSSWPKKRAKRSARTATRPAATLTSRSAEMIEAVH
jgi:hypothetical protein